MADLEKQFDEAMLNIYSRAKQEAGHRATAFRQMLERDRGVLTAKKLINSKSQGDGYTELQIRNRLDLTVEALVIDNPRWHPLFSETDLEQARRRLKANGYTRD